MPRNEDVNCFSLNSWIKAFCAVSFDFNLGHVLDYVYPDILTDHEKHVLPKLSLPDYNSSSHHSNGDILYYIRVRRSDSRDIIASCADPDGFLFCGVFFHTEMRLDLHRHFSQSSLVLVLTEPNTEFLRNFMLVFGPIYFEHGNSILPPILHFLQSLCPTPPPPGRAPRFSSEQLLSVISVSLHHSIASKSVTVSSSLGVDGSEVGEVQLLVEHMDGDQRITFPANEEEKKMRTKDERARDTISEDQIIRKNDNIPIKLVVGESSLKNDPDNNIIAQANELKPSLAPPHIFDSKDGKLNGSNSSCAKSNNNNTNTDCDENNEDDDSHDGLSIIMESCLRRPGLFQDSDLSVLLPFKNQLWAIWEVLISGEPLFVFAPSADYCSSVVCALASLMSPLGFSGDVRPYMNPLDPDFKIFIEAATNYQKNNNNNNSSSTHNMVSFSGLSTGSLLNSPHNTSSPINSVDGNSFVSHLTNIHSSVPNGTSKLMKGIFGVSALLPQIKNNNTPSSRGTLNNNKAQNNSAFNANFNNSIHTKSFSAPSPPTLSTTTGSSFSPSTTTNNNVNNTLLLTSPINDNSAISTTSNNMVSPTNAVSSSLHPCIIGVCNPQALITLGLRMPNVMLAGLDLKMESSILKLDSWLNGKAVFERRFVVPSLYSLNGFSTLPSNYSGTSSSLEKGIQMKSFSLRNSPLLSHMGGNFVNGGGGGPPAVISTTSSANHSRSASNLHGVVSPSPTPPVATASNSMDTKETAETGYVFALYFSTKPSLPQDPRVLKALLTNSTKETGNTFVSRPSSQYHPQFTVQPPSSPSPIGLPPHHGDASSSSAYDSIDSDGEFDVDVVADLPNEFVLDQKNPGQDHQSRNRGEVHACFHNSSLLCSFDCGKCDLISQIDDTENDQRGIENKQQNTFKPLSVCFKMNDNEFYGKSHKDLNSEMSKSQFKQNIHHNEENVTCGDSVYQPHSSVITGISSSLTKGNFLISSGGTRPTVSPPTCPPRALINNSILRSHFSKLTEAFLHPFGRFLFPPTPRTPWDPVPTVAAFNPVSFFAGSVLPSGSSTNVPAHFVEMLTIPPPQYVYPFCDATPTQLATLYSKFIRTLTFRSWFDKRVRNALITARRTHLKLCLECTEQQISGETISAKELKNIVQNIDTHLELSSIRAQMRISIDKEEKLQNIKKMCEAAIMEKDATAAAMAAITMRKQNQSFMGSVFGWGSSQISLSDLNHQKGAGGT